jgi:uncharacterized RDD family membrane protein YckC
VFRRRYAAAAVDHQAPYDWPDRLRRRPWPKAEAVTQIPEAATPNGARPQVGPGAVSGLGPRLAAFVIDSLLSIGIAILSTGPPPGAAYNFVVFAAFLAIELIFVTLAGQTPGMRVAGVVVMAAADGSKPRLRWVALRTLLLAAVVPALIMDASGRAMHDRAAGTVMVRTR